MLCVLTVIMCCGTCAAAMLCVAGQLVGSREIEDWRIIIFVNEITALYLGQTGV